MSSIQTVGLKSIGKNQRLLVQKQIHNHAQKLERATNVSKLKLAVKPIHRNENGAIFEAALNAQYGKRRIHTEFEDRNAVKAITGVFNSLEQAVMHK